MFRNVRVKGEIIIFSYNDRPILVSVNDANTQREYKFKDSVYLNTLHNDIGWLNANLFNITIHPIAVLSDQKIISAQCINNVLYEQVISHEIRYDTITESIFNTIINLEYINFFDTGALMR
jgi:hypothetical protein